jgi:hypothetical protein
MNFAKIIWRASGLPMLISPAFAKVENRGRVLLLYGEPEEIERFPSSNEARAYLIWHFFEIEGGVEFVFVDLKNSGDMELVHSTARNELQDPAWQRWLNPGR